MTTALSQAELDNSLKGITIPPRPQVLMNLSREMKKDNPDVRLISSLIVGDVGLSAAVLKTVNSPFFGLANRIGSVNQAVNLLGLKSTFQIVTGLVLKSAIAGNRQSLERFWDSAEKVANISAYIASTLPRVARDDAYTFGLFHDVGIPILMQKFPEYRKTLEMAAGIADRPITSVEEEIHSTNHAVLGYLMAKSWFLPPNLCEGILRHHDISVFDEADPITPQARTFIAVTCLAEHLNDEVSRMRNNVQWEQMGERVLDHLGLIEVEYLDLKEEVSNLIA